MDKKTVTAIIAAYNEEDLIIETIKAVKSLKDVDDILVVDDGSSDSTVEKAKSTGVEVLNLPVNKGKGAAMREALLKVDCCYVLFLDGDLGEHAREASKLVTTILNGETDMAIADFPKAKTKGGFGLAKGFGRRTIKYYTGYDMNEPLSGQRVVKKEALDKIAIADGFGVEVAMTIDVVNQGYKVTEVPVNMSHRETGRDLKGFIHRGKQFTDILAVFITRAFRRE